MSDWDEIDVRVALSISAPGQNLPFTVRIWTAMNDRFGSNSDLQRHLEHCRIPARKQTLKENPPPEGEGSLSGGQITQLLRRVSLIAGEGLGARDGAGHRASVHAGLFSGVGGEFLRSARPAVCVAICNTIPRFPKFRPLGQMFRQLSWRQFNPHQVLVDIP
jgi:hypothetical protein